MTDSEPHVPATMPNTLRQGSVKPGDALTVLYSPDDTLVGRVIYLTDGCIAVGRQPGEAGLTMNDGRASRLHADVSWDADRQSYVVRDARSLNGTRINGRSVTTERLVPNDLLRIGDTVFQFGPVPLDCVGWKAPAGQLAGRSGALKRMLAAVDRVAGSDLCVLIEGPTGTGKDLVARSLHERSGVRGPFVPVNCAAIPSELAESVLFGHARGAFTGADTARPGLIAAASGGTLFLDELGELPLPLQAKLLRVVEDGLVRPVGARRPVKVEVRFLAATNRALKAEVTAGRFREDLLARLGQWVIELAPLSQRREDLLEIVLRLTAEHTPKGQAPPLLSGDFFEALALYAWPQNVRELKNVVRQALLMVGDEGVLKLLHLPAKLRQVAAQPEASAVEDVAESLPPQGTVPTPSELQLLLDHFRGNVSEVARHTGKPRAQVYRWMRRFGLEARSYR